MSEVAGAPNPWAITPELEWFLGWHDWEGQLNDHERYQLASTRAAFEPPDEIELPFERDYSSTPEDELGDPFARAAEKLEAELKLYSRPRN